eukprot:scaffold32495_cov60-Phaeocystis_antarctica.AAC.1
MRTVPHGHLRQLDHWRGSLAPVLIPAPFPAHLLQRRAACVVSTQHLRGERAARRQRRVHRHPVAGVVTRPAHLAHEEIVPAVGRRRRAAVGRRLLPIARAQGGEVVP